MHCKNDSSMYYDCVGSLDMRMECRDALLCVRGEGVMSIVQILQDALPFISIDDIPAIPPAFITYLAMSSLVIGIGGISMSFRCEVEADKRCLIDARINCESLICQSNGSDVIEYPLLPMLSTQGTNIVSLEVRCPSLPDIIVREMLKILKWDDSNANVELLERYEIFIHMMMI